MTAMADLFLGGRGFINHTGLASSDPANDGFLTKPSH